MACPTCDHTMQRITGADEVSVYMCPRCGTNKIEDSSLSEPRVYVPSLVDRVSDFKATSELSIVEEFMWNKLGIHEAITNEVNKCPTPPGETEPDQSSPT